MPLPRRLHALSWDLRSRRWGSWFPSEERRRTVREDIDWFVQHAGPASARVLDLGCGAGDYSLELARRGYQVVGCDFSAGMLREARKKLGREQGLTCSFKQADFNKPLHARDGAFDHIVTVWALQHAVELPAVLAEVARILQPGGLLMVIVPGEPWRPEYGGRRQRSGLRRRVRRLARRVVPAPSGRRFTHETLVKVLNEVGFVLAANEGTARYCRLILRAAGPPESGSLPGEGRDDLG